MNYEEKYKEMKKRVLAIGQGYVKEVDYNSPRSIAEYIDPELRESEDERIIRTLKEIVNWGCAKNISVENNVELKDCLAWLEKQGEQIFDNSAKTCKGKPKFKVGDTIVEKDLDEYDYETIKDIKDGQYIFTDGYCMNIDEQEGWQLVKTIVNIEQNFSWSKEDELMIQDAIHWINEFQKSNRCKDENDMQNSVTCENWLKSLKDRIQPKQEWSEEDEKKIMWLVRLISTAGFRELDNDKMPCSRSELLDWLNAHHFDYRGLIKKSLALEAPEGMYNTKTE